MTSFEETELRLGLSGVDGGSGSGSMMSGGGDEVVNTNGKRGYDETIMDLKLKLSSDDQENRGGVGGVDGCSDKAQTVGWPPVRSYRKNMLSIQKNSSLLRKDEATGGGGAAFVKVSMDGAPYLRKVDLKMYKNYQNLSDALGNMFSSFTIGNNGSKGLKDFMNETKLMDLLNNSDYVLTYEDRDEIGCSSAMFLGSNFSFNCHY